MVVRGKKMTVIVPILLIFLVGGPLVVHEALRLTELLSQCRQRWVENDRLLHNTICTADSRYAHGSKVEDVCKQAYAENAVSPEACALRELWRQGAVYHLWDSVVGSPWMLFGLLGGVLFLFFQAWQYRAQRHLQERMYKHTMELVNGARASPLPPSPPPIQFIMPPSQPQSRYDYEHEYERAQLDRPRSRLDL